MSEPSSAPWIIRPATMADRAALTELFGMGDEHHREALSGRFRLPQGPVRDDGLLADWLNHSDGAILLAEADGRAVGLLHVWLRRTPDIPILVPRRYAEIDNIAVDAAYRGRGIGRALMEAAERWALERGASEDELTVWEFNHGAFAFYKELGYATISRRMARPLIAPDGEA
jgi:ribosomal protein S18 acetylase RimI-like enzyme